MLTKKVLINRNFRELGFGGFVFVLRFYVFDKPILEEYFFRLKGLNLFQSCLYVGQDDFSLAVREMHHFF